MNRIAFKSSIVKSIPPLDTGQGKRICSGARVGPLQMQDRLQASENEREAPLGINAKATDISPSPADRRTLLEFEPHQVARAGRFLLLAGARKLLKHHQDELLRADGFEPGPSVDTRLGYARTCSCMWSRFLPDGVRVTYSSQHQRSMYQGLTTCSSWSACPVCGAKISERRRRELEQAVHAARERGYVVVLSTFTLRHHQGDDLGALLDELRDMYSDLKTSRSWKRLTSEYGIYGPGRSGKLEHRLYSVRALENTYGYNGHHPHLHSLFFLAPGSDVSAFEGELRTLWYEQSGGQLVPDGDTGELLPLDPDLWERGCTAASNDGKVAEYLAKFGRDPKWDVAHEVAKANVKTGRKPGHSKHYTMTDLLWSFVEGANKQHGAAWVEWAIAAKGRAQLTWSPGLRVFFGLGQEQTDEQIAKDASDYQEDLAVLDDLTWHLVRHLEKRAELLRVADLGDREIVREWLMTLRTQHYQNASPGASQEHQGQSKRGFRYGSG